jgi:hypothetical protein
VIHKPTASIAKSRSLSPNWMGGWRVSSLIPRLYQGAGTYRNSGTVRALYCRPADCWSFLLCFDAWPISTP